MSQQEPLLELYREFSDKEKLGWIIRDFNLLKKRFSRLQRENNNLKVRNEKLSKKIKEDDLQYPSKLSGQTTVSVKAYFKLRERYKQMEERFWEVNQELNKLKGESTCEKL